MFTLTTIAQEITLQAKESGIFAYIQNHDTLSRDDVLNIFESWASEFIVLHTEHEWEDDLYDEIDVFLLKKQTELVKAYEGKDFEICLTFN